MQRQKERKRKSQTLVRKSLRGGRQGKVAFPWRRSEPLCKACSNDLNQRHARRAWNLPRGCVWAAGTYLSFSEPLSESSTAFLHSSNRSLTQPCLSGYSVISCRREDQTRMEKEGHQYKVVHSKGAFTDTYTLSEHGIGVDVWLLPLHETDCWAIWIWNSVCSRSLWSSS